MDPRKHLRGRALNADTLAINVNIIALEDVKAPGKTPSQSPIETLEKSVKYV